jgi:PKHD-type hydroxylase
MNPHVLYRVWPRELPAELCRLIVGLGNRLTAVKATLVDERAPDGQRLDEGVRRTDVGFWDETHWINGLLAHYAALANRETWGLDIALTPGVQYAIYTETSFFDWHIDELAQPYGPLAPTRWVGLNRKLSVIVNLTDPQAYEGGDVQLRDRLGNPLTIDGAREQGTVLVFLANVAHSVTPVTAGVRNSLVGWCLGPSLR